MFDPFESFYRGLFSRGGLVPPKDEHQIQDRTARVDNRIRVNNFIIRNLAPSTDDY